MTRQRILSLETIADINQEIVRCGYHPNYLTYIDQTRDIPDEFVFDYEYFQVTTTTVTSSGSSVSTTTSRSLTSENLSPDSLEPTGPINPDGLGPAGPLLPGCSGPDDLGPDSLGPDSLIPDSSNPDDLGPLTPSGPGGPGGPGCPLSPGSPIDGLPIICSSTWQVRTFDASYVRIHIYLFIYCV